MKKTSPHPNIIDIERIALAPLKGEPEFVSRRAAIVSLTMLAIGPNLPIVDVDDRLVIVDGWVMKKSELLPE